MKEALAFDVEAFFVSPLSVNRYPLSVNRNNRSEPFYTLIASCALAQNKLH